MEHVQKLNLSYNYQQQTSSCAKTATATTENNNKLPCSILGFPIVSMNGAVGVQLVNYPENGSSSTTTTTPWKVQELFCEPLSYDITVKALSLSKQLGHCCQFYYDDKIYANPSNDLQFAIIQRFANITGIQQIQCQDDFAAIMKGKGEPIRLVIMCGEEGRDNAMTVLTNSFGKDAYVVRAGSTGWFVEVLMKGVNKGSGLKRMCSQINLDIKNTIAFGDGYNDIEFLQMSGLGIAMKNSYEKVQQVADQVTQFTNAQDGVRLKLMEMENEGLLKFPN